MKKQFLLIAFFVLAMMAGSLTSYGQTKLVPGISVGQPITPISCVATASALNPIPGVPFTYAMNNGTGATSLNWTWWATQDKDFITAAGTTNISKMLLSPQTATPGTDLVATSVSPTYGVDNSTGVAGGANSVSITWSAGILAKTKYQADATDNGNGKFSTFVVGYSEGLAGCSDNIQVFEIKPSPNFTIDIAAITAAGATLNWGVDDQTRCVDVVRSAKYTGPNEITVDYGTNTFYYEVAAANFVNNFTPQFRVISGLNTDQEAVITLYPTYADATGGTNALWNSASIKASDITAATDFRVSKGLEANSVADITNGVSFFVKVLITNKTEESLTPNPFVLAVDAEDNVTLATGVATTDSNWDMEDADCTAMDDTADQVDRSTITISPRPTLLMTTGVGGTTNEPNTPANLPDDVINKLP
jgi:hypothetical protein